MSTHHLKLAAGVVSAVLLGAVVACSDNSGSNPTPAPSLTRAQADSLGEAVAMDASDLADASGFDATTAVTLVAPVAGVMGPPCVPALSPLPVANSDADLAPDSLRFDFTGCGFTRGPMTHSLSGFIDVIDPTPTVTDFDVRMVFTDFNRTMTNTALSRTTSITHNGEREIAVSPDTIGHTIVGFRTDYSYANGATASHEKDWVAKFTADQAGSIVFGMPLPAGGLTANGTSTWVKAFRSWTGTVSTPVALHYDPACQLTPRFDAGKLVMVVTRDTNSSTVTIEFTACGQYTVTRS